MDVVVHQQPGTRPSDLPLMWLLRHPRPLTLKAGERLYIVHGGGLFGYAKVLELSQPDAAGTVTVVCGTLMRTTLPCRVRSFRGLRYRWWDRSAEKAA